MDFRSPWIFLIAPFILGSLYLILRKQRPASLKVSSVNLFSGIGINWKMRFHFIPNLLRLTALIFFIIALAGPRIVLDQAVRKVEGVDIVLALDTSGSMAAEDFTLNNKRTNRLEVVKNVVEDFIRKRSHDRIGLVAFAGLAYTVCPLTTDYSWLLDNLERIELNSIDQDGTAIGSGILSAVSRLKNSQAKSKIIIVLTDGMNNAGKVDPLSAAKAAVQLGIKIYTIGAGTKGYAPMPVQDYFGRKFYQNVLIDIDEDTLKKVAQETNGLYFRATDTASLDEIYKTIDRLEKTKIEDIGYKEYKELYARFLLAALIILLVEIILVNTLFLRLP